MDCVKELLIILAKQCMTQESAMLQLVVCMLSKLTLKKLTSFPHWMLGYILSMKLKAFSKILYNPKCL